NVVDPLALAGRYGADALRFALTRAASPGHDVPLAEEWVEGARNFVNKLWNSARFVALNLDGRPLAELEGAGPPPLGELTLPERWVLSRLAQVTASVDEGFERYEFAQGVQKLQAFFWDEFCDWYLELAKLPLNEGGASRERAQRLVAAGATIVVPLEGVVDIGAAMADIDRQIEKHAKELAAVEAKLADESFVTKAPDHVVGGMRSRQSAAQEALATLRAQREQLV